MVSEKWKFHIYYFVRFFGDAFFYPFMMIYFVSKGIADENLGVILALRMITAMLVNPLWNFLVKDIRISRIVLKIITVVEGALIIVISRVSGFELYALIAVLIAFFCSPSFQIQDGFTATFASENNVEYTSIRLWGSVAYVIASAIAGFLITASGYEVLFLISGSFFIFTSVIVFWIKPLKNETNLAKTPKRDFRALMKNKDFFRYLLFYTLAIGAINIGDSFFSVYVTTMKGMAPIAYGLLYSGFVLVEVIAMRVMLYKGQGLKEKNLLLFSISFVIIRFVLYGLDLPLSVVSIITLFRGLSWGIVIYAHLRFLIKIVGIENITAAILILTLAFSLFAAGGNWLFGALIKTLGFNVLYFSCAGLLVIAILVMLILPPKAHYDFNHRPIE
ncbi:MAG: MFS transporter [Candidatus Izemoplasmatales bacterium]|jgi:PPP family 3-phenylpropionic acid transporter